MRSLHSGPASDISRHQDTSVTFAVLIGAIVKTQAANNSSYCSRKGSHSPPKSKAKTAFLSHCCSTKTTTVLAEGPVKFELSPLPGEQIQGTSTLYYYLTLYLTVPQVEKSVAPEIYHPCIIASRFILGQRKKRKNKGKTQFKKLLYPSTFTSFQELKAGPSTDRPPQPSLFTPA